jgi:hypothetical protein
MNVALAVLLSVGFVCAVGTAIVWTPSTTELVAQQAMVMVPVKQPNGQVIYIMQAGQNQQQTLAASVQQTAQPQPMPLKVAVAVPMEQPQTAPAAPKVCRKKIAGLFER